MTYRYRYINPSPVVFASESWAPELGEEREFDHPIDHPFLQLVLPEAPAVVAVTEEPESAVAGDDETEGQ